jgi:hypothetical protein
MALVSTGCAEQRAPIDRVQPNAIQKSELTGHEWYYQRTVVDVPAADGFTFVGSTDFESVSRIRWDIQKDYLYARRSFEFIEGAAGKAAKQPDEDFNGEVLAAYRIEKHFDITKAYNQTTGEELNILEENATDRPWYERTHMRVDWSQNLVTNYDLAFERKTIESVPYYVEDKSPGDDDTHPDAPHFAHRDDGGLYYFDVTNKIHAQAGTVHIDGYGEVAACQLRGRDTTQCGSGEYAIRNSFKVVDPDNDYQPMPYKGKPTEKFGYFSNERLVYDTKEGIRQQKRKRFINRFNLWENWTDESGDVLPPAERQLDPIVYHVNRQFPDDLIEQARQTADDWNRIFTDAVEALGKDLEDDQRVFILCPNNPVQPSDPEECGEPGTSPRLGDIRYSFMAYVPEYMEYGLLGLGPSNSDPLTGEIISGMAYVYHHNNTSAHQTQEMVQLLNDTLPRDQYIDGVDLTQWREQLDDTTIARHGATGTPSSSKRQHSLSAAEHMVDSLVTRPSFKQWKGRRRQITQADRREIREQGFNQWLEPTLDQIHEREHTGLAQRDEFSGLSKFQDTYLEDLMVDDQMLVGMGQFPSGSSMTDGERNLTSPARGGFIQSAIKRYKMRQTFARRHNMYLPEMADEGLMGLARELKGRDSDEVYDIIRDSVYRSVLTHEVGHSLGLMHNFGGSDDAINFKNEYWNIRDDGSVGPRLNDPITEEEVNQRIHDYAYSSVMDYTGKLTIGGLGTGKYDRAAILYGYAHKVEVFEETPGTDPQDLAAWSERDGSVLRFTDDGPESVHYTSFYNQMGEDLYAADNRRLVDVDDLRTQDGERDWSTAVIDGNTYHRVPYIFCAENRADISDHCLTRDYGADSYERMKHMLDNLDTWYIRRAFARGRLGLNNMSYVSSQYGSTFMRLKRWNDLYGLYAGDILPRYFDEQEMREFLTDPVDGWGAKTWAVQNAFNYLVQTLLMPSVGTYSGPFRQPGGGGLVQAQRTSSLTAPVRNKRLGVTDARYYSTSWGDGDRNCGYYWQNCLHHVGFYLDKIMATFALSDSSTNFVARSTPEDIRQWEIGYWTTFPDQLSKINEAMMGRDWDTVAPYIDGDGELAWPNYAGALDTEHGAPVDPSATFTIKLYWQLLGQLRFPDTYDQSFVESSRVWVEGTGQQPELAADQKVTITDPQSNLTYGAMDLEPDGAGENMIERARDMIPWTTYCDDADQTPTDADDCNDDIGEAGRRFYTREFRDYIELVKVVADVNAVRSYGSPFSP